MTALAGQPSDQVDEILATGRSGITTVFVSMAARHPEGADAAYLAWHSLDHRPEQYRLAALRSTMRLVSTPQCRAARAVGGASLDAVDHVMTYFFTDLSGLAGFTELSTALRNAGRTPPVLPPVSRGVYDVRDIAAAPVVKIGADVLPWWPAAGVYLLVEPSPGPVHELLDVPGVAGTWSAVAADVGPISAAPPGQQLTFCFLNDDPVKVAERLRPVVLARSRAVGAPPALAAPFHLVVPHQWERHLP